MTTKTTESLENSNDVEGLPKQWPEWVKNQFDQLRQTEKETETFLPESAPEWTYKMLLEIVKLSFPKMDLTDFASSGPAELGAFCGHHQWLEESEYGFEAQLERLEQACQNLDDLLRRKLSAKNYAKLLAAGEKYGADLEAFFDVVEFTLQKKEEIIKQCIQVAEHQPLSEKADFFDLYSKSLQTQTFDVQGLPVFAKFPGTPQIYTLMIMFWRHVNQLPSTKALHDWLCLLLGEKNIGPYDNGRVKGICKRFGIRLRSRGRPSKKGH